MISITAIENSSDLDERLYASLLEMVSPQRKQRAARFLRREDACRCIVSEVLAKYCIAIRQRIPMNEIVFQIDAFGKPFVADTLSVNFNVSHSKSWVVCAVDNAPVGIDVEHIHDHDIAVAKRFFHPDEYAGMLALPESLRKERFFDLWTLKESYIKAIGKGLSCPLDSFAVAFKRDRIAVQTNKDLPGMFFKQYNFDAEYKCSVCAARDCFPGKIEIMTPAALLDKTLKARIYAPLLSMGEGAGG